MNTQMNKGGFIFFAWVSTFNAPKIVPEKYFVGKNYPHYSQ